MITICKLAGWSLPALFLEHGQALGAIPLALGLVAEVHATKVEPLDGTILVVATNHLAVGHLKLVSHISLRSQVFANSLFLVFTNCLHYYDVKLSSL